MELIFLSVKTEGYSGMYRDLESPPARPFILKKYTSNFKNIFIYNSNFKKIIYVPYIHFPQNFNPKTFLKKLVENK